MQLHDENMKDRSEWQATVQIENKYDLVIKAVKYSPGDTMKCMNE